MMVFIADFTSDISYCVPFSMSYMTDDLTDPDEGYSLAVFNIVMCLM